MKNKIRWGIMGAGKIARKFASDVKLVPDAELVAIGSESAERAGQFASELGIGRHYGSYASMLADSDLDIIYIATRNQAHAGCALLCLDAGKPVLCEKPFAINRSQAEKVIQRARAQKLFLMESMWTRFFPLIRRIREMIAQGDIGEVKLIQGDFGFKSEFDASSRLYQKSMGGGALLDVGVYPISLATMLLGSPQKIASVATLATTGVDSQISLLFSYPTGCLANLSASLDVDSPKEIKISGTRGSIHIHVPFWKPHTITIQKPGQAPETVQSPYAGFGYHYEIAEINRLLKNKRLESPEMTLDDTLQIMGILDVIRSQCGIVYPEDGQ